MTNKVRGELELTLGKKKIVLNPTFDRLVKLETELGRSLVQLANEIGQQRMSFIDTATVIAVLSKPPRMSVDEVGKLLQEHGLLSVAPLLQGLIEKVLTGGKTVDPEDMDPPRAAS